MQNIGFYAALPVNLKMKISLKVLYIYIFLSIHIYFDNSQIPCVRNGYVVDKEDTTSI